MESHDTRIIRIGVDLGGTKIEAIALDAAGETLARRRIATPVHDYQEIVQAVATLVRDIESEAGQRGCVGVGAPGAISTHTGLVKNSNTAVVNGRPLDVDLTRALQRPVRVANDANCFALSEAIDGAGRGARVVFGVILGTGVGGGVIVDGKIVEGRNHVAGEWGHTPLPWMTPEEYPGEPCFCGHRGCIETFLCGSGLARDYEKRSGAHRPAIEIVARAKAGEPAAQASLEAFQDRLARALAIVVDLIDPDVIALGGGVSNISWLYEGLAARVGENAFTDSCDTKILPNVHGDSGGVRGAAWLWSVDEIA
ncbi:MAG: ROK family protein [Methylocystis sp.]|uniref:ROK family protein n=1 Tax=Methylocystis sp. TaxID=1911079 RepID=UPI003D0F2EBE